MLSGAILTVTESFLFVPEMVGWIKIGSLGDDVPPAATSGRKDAYDRHAHSSISSLLAQHLVIITALRYVSSTTIDTCTRAPPTWGSLGTTVS